MSAVEWLRRLRITALVTWLILAPWFMLYVAAEFVLHFFGIPHPHIR